MLNRNSVLPPPPRYLKQSAYGAALDAGNVAPMIETNNILTSPSGPEYQFLVGEGEHPTRPYYSVLQLGKWLRNFSS